VKKKIIKKIFKLAPKPQRALGWRWGKILKLPQPNPTPTLNK